MGGGGKQNKLYASQMQQYCRLSLGQMIFLSIFNDKFEISYSH